MTIKHVKNMKTHKRKHVKNDIAIMTNISYSSSLEQITNISQSASLENLV